MSHDKIKSAAPRRMAETSESYAAAWRKVIVELQAAGNNSPAGEPQRFTISYNGMGPIATWTDSLFGGGMNRNQRR